MVRGMGSPDPADPGAADVARYGRRKGRRVPTDRPMRAPRPSDARPAPLSSDRQERLSHAHPHHQRRRRLRSGHRRPGPWSVGPARPATTSSSWSPPWPTTAGPGPRSGPSTSGNRSPSSRWRSPAWPHVPTFGIEGPPALAVILACIEGFGPRPDLVVSGINHGINAGRSALHSGTVGATLTGAQFGVRGLAVSIAWGEDPVPWETPVALAAGIVPALAAMEPATILNLNVPAVAPHLLRGLRHGTLGTVGLIRAVRPESTPFPVGGTPVDPTSRAITLTLRGMGVASDRLAERAELEPDSDAALIADGWATLTPLLGVREDASGPGRAAIAAALATYPESGL